MVDASADSLCRVDKKFSGLQHASDAVNGSQPNGVVKRRLMCQGGAEVNAVTAPIIVRLTYHYNNADYDTVGDALNARHRYHL